MGGGYAHQTKGTPMALAAEINKMKVQIDALRRQIVNIGIQIDTVDNELIIGSNRGLVVNGDATVGGTLTVSGGEIRVLNAAGSVGLTINETGLSVYNGATVEVLAGLINSSPAIYGLGVRPYGGSALQQVGGWLGSGALSESGVSTSSHYVTFSGSSTVTAEIGPSGAAMISGGFEIDANAAGVEASVVILIDGGPNTIEIARLHVASTAATTVGGTFQWGSLSAGTHTFTAQYLTSGTGTADFYGNFYIQPL